MGKRGAALMVEGAYAEGSSGDGDKDDSESGEEEEEEDASDSNLERDTQCCVCGEQVTGEKLECSLNTKAYKCTRISHVACGGEDVEDASEWLCPTCEAATDLEDTEKLLAIRHVSNAAAAGDGGRPREVYVKKAHDAYIHCSWVPFEAVELASKLFLAMKLRYRAFMKKVDDAGGVEALEELQEEQGLENGIKPTWLIPERVIAHEVDGGTDHYLFKWKELDYDECTWESEEDVAEHDLEAYVHAFRNLESPEDMAKGLAAAHNKARRRAADNKAFKETPKFLAGGLLHDYQLEGLNWMLLKYKRGQNMVLADEMGLGKTVQTVALLASLRAQGIAEPHLIVVPLSTLANWERELAKWAPQLYSVTLKGNQPSRDTVHKYDTYMPEEGGHKGHKGKGRKRPIRFNVMLTTYEIAISDKSFLNSFNWCTLVVDEGHRLRNAKSRLYQLLTDTRAQSRLLLTGTPLQNNMDELFQLMAFIEPEKFSDLAMFQAEYSTVSQQEQVQKLHELLYPHLLRRIKKDVLKQLPPKREQIVRIELCEKQKKFYKQILVKEFPALAGRGGGHEKVRKLRNVMMELRKCCNHPIYFSENFFADLAAESLEDLVAHSGKLALLDRMMVLFKERGHRVLLYSQFTVTLDILGTWLFKRNYLFQRIDGTVRGAERQARIDRFNNEPQYWVFLLSTRAGGLGINLATADTIVIFDSDWNPHNDLQAQARAHRLGQRRPVFTYRFVARGTVEERMMQVTKEKRMMEQVVMGKQDLKQSELDDILRHGATELFAEESGDDTAAKSKRIVYDDAALKELLDREVRLKEAEEDAADDFMGSFKVANFELTEAEAKELKDSAAAAAAPAPAPPPPPPGGSFWGGLLKDKWQSAAPPPASAEATQPMGRGRRPRRTVNYAENGEAGEEEGGKGPARKRPRNLQPDELDWDPEKEGEADAAEDADMELRAGAEAAAGEAAAGVAANGQRVSVVAAPHAAPTLQPAAPGRQQPWGVSVHGNPEDAANFYLFGLSQGARMEFVRCVMAFGLPLDGRDVFSFDEYGARIRSRSPRLAKVDPENLASYTRYFMGCLDCLCDENGLDCENIVLPSRGPRLEPGMVQPRKLILGHLPPSTMFRRIGALHLLREVLRAGVLGEEGDGEEGGLFARRARSGSFMQALGTSEPARFYLREWRAVADRRLVECVLEYGADAWDRIIADPQMLSHLERVVFHGQQNAPPYTHADGGDAPRADAAAAADASDGARAGAEAGAVAASVPREQAGVIVIDDSDDDTPAEPAAGNSGPVAPVATSAPVATTSAAAGGKEAVPDGSAPQEGVAAGGVQRPADGTPATNAEQPQPGAQPGARGAEADGTGDGSTRTGDHTSAVHADNPSAGGGRVPDAGPGTAGTASGAASAPEAPSAGAGPVAAAATAATQPAGPDKDKDAAAGAAAASAPDQPPVTGTASAEAGGADGASNVPTSQGGGAGGPVGGPGAGTTAAAPAANRTSVSRIVLRRLESGEHAEGGGAASQDKAPSTAPAPAARAADAAPASASGAEVAAVGTNATSVKPTDPPAQPGHANGASNDASASAAEVRKAAARGSTAPPEAPAAPEGSAGVAGGGGGVSDGLHQSAPSATRQRSPCAPDASGSARVQAPAADADVAAPGAPHVATGGAAVAAAAATGTRAGGGAPAGAEEAGVDAVAAGALAERRKHFLRMRFENLCFVVAMEVRTWPPDKVKYAGGSAFPQSLTRPIVQPGQLLLFRQHQQHIKQAMARIMDHTGAASGSGQSQTQQQDAAQQFRNLVKDYENELRRVHQHALKMLTAYYPTGTLPQEVKPYAHVNRPAVGARPGARLATEHPQYQQSALAAAAQGSSRQPDARHAAGSAPRGAAGGGHAAADATYRQLLVTMEPPPAGQRVGPSQAVLQQQQQQQQRQLLQMQMQQQQQQMRQQAASYRYTQQQQASQQRTDGQRAHMQQQQPQTPAANVAGAGGYHSQAVHVPHQLASAGQGAGLQRPGWQQQQQQQQQHTHQHHQAQRLQVGQSAGYGGHMGGR